MMRTVSLKTWSHHAEQDTPAFFQIFHGQTFPHHTHFRVTLPQTENSFDRMVCFSSGSFFVYSVAFCTFNWVHAIPLSSRRLFSRGKLLIITFFILKTVTKRRKRITGVFFSHKKTHVHVTVSFPHETVQFHAGGPHRTLDIGWVVSLF